MENKKSSHDDNSNNNNNKRSLVSPPENPQTHVVPRIDNNYLPSLEITATTPLPPVTSLTHPGSPIHVTVENGFREDSYGYNNPLHRYQKNYNKKSTSNEDTNADSRKGMPFLYGYGNIVFLLLVLTSRF